MNNATRAIKRSVTHNEIVTVDASHEIEETLTAECDDHVQNGLVHEFWGATVEGHEWRVHVRYENEDQANAPSH